MGIKANVNVSSFKMVTLSPLCRNCIDGGGKFFIDGKPHPELAWEELRLTPNCGVKPQIGDSLCPIKSGHAKL